MNGYQGDGFLSVAARTGGINLAMAGACNGWCLGLVVPISSIVGLLILDSWNVLITK